MGDEELLGQAFEDSRPIKKLRDVVSVRDPWIYGGPSPSWITVVTIKGTHDGFRALATLDEAGADQIILTRCDEVDAKNELGFSVTVLWIYSDDFRRDVIRAVGS